MFENKKILDRLILILVIILTVVRIILWMKAPIMIYTEELNDDRLLYEYSNTMAKGEWLGEYNQLTLVKGISFSVFQLICNKLMIPYSFGLASLNILSAIIVCIALKTKINKKWLYIIYLGLIFSPTGFTTIISQRHYRNAIIVPTILFVFGSYIGLFLRKNESKKKMLLWGILAGISLVFFWFVKEDSIWIVPFIATISLLIIIWLIINEKENIIMKTLITGMPIIFLIAANLVISCVNNKYYGVFTVNDKSYSEFGKMMSNLFTIEDKNRTASDSIWITKNMLESAYAVSPTFSDLKANMEVCASWTDGDGEVKGDLIIWKIRYIMSVQNYYETATKAEEFCKQVNIELENAFVTGQLTKDNNIHIASQMRGLEFKDILNYFPSAIEWINDFSKYDKCGVVDGTSNGNIEKIEEIQSFLRSKTIYPSENSSSETKAISNNIVNIYKKIAVPTNVIAMAGYIIFTVHMLFQLKSKKFEKIDLWFVTTGVLLSSFVLTFEINLFLHFFDIDKLNAYRTFYSAGVFPLIEVFKLISLYCFITEIKELISIKKAKNAMQND